MQHPTRLTTVHACWCRWLSTIGIFRNNFSHCNACSLMAELRYFPTQPMQKIISSTEMLCASLNFNYFIQFNVSKTVLALWNSCLSTWSLSLPVITKQHSESANLRQGQNLTEDSFSRREHIVSNWFNLETCFKVIDDGTIGQFTYDFLFVFYSNFGRLFHDLLSSPISQHRVWSEITSHNPLNWRVASLSRCS